MQTVESKMLRWGFLILLVAGCAQGPRHVLEVEGVRVRAPRPELARAVAERVELGRTRLEERLPDIDTTPVEVWVQESGSPGAVIGMGVGHSSSAYTLREPGRTPRVFVTSGNYANVLQHELTHALLGKSWGLLPIAIEEGLCTYLNDEFADPEMTVVHLCCAAQAGDGTVYTVSLEVRDTEGEPSRHRAFWGTGGGSDATNSGLGLEEILSIPDSRGLRELNRAEIGHVYGVGLAIVRRIVSAHGLDALHSLCLRASEEGRERVPAEQILVAAQIENEAQFSEIAREELRKARIVSALSAPSFWGVAGRAVRAAGAIRGPEEFLSRCEGTLRIAGEELDLAALPQFRAWLDENWRQLLETPEPGGSEQKSP